MNGIIINIDPVIVSVGGVTLRWYSVAVVLAVVVAALIATREAKRFGFPPDEILSLLPWVLMAGIVGARLFHLFDQFRYYVNNPLEILRLQQSGLAIWGALVGGGVAVFIYARIRHISPGRFADILTPALLVGQIIGRFGCIVNGDAAGGATNLPWGFIYTHPGALISPELYALPTHPYPVYEMLWNAIALALLLRLRHRFMQTGLLFTGYILLYASGRFALGFARQENTVLWGLQQAQVLAAIMVVVSALTFIHLLRKTAMTPKSAARMQQT